MGAVSLLDKEMMDGARSAEGNSALTVVVAIARDDRKGTETARDGACLNLEAKKVRRVCATDHGYKVHKVCNVVTSDTLQKRVKARAWFDRCVIYHV